MKTVLAVFTNDVFIWMVVSGSLLSSFQTISELSLENFMFAFVCLCVQICHHGFSNVSEEHYGPRPLFVRRNYILFYWASRNMFCYYFKIPVMI